MRRANEEFCWLPQSLITIFCDTLSVIVYPLRNYWYFHFLHPIWLRLPTETLTLFYDYRPWTGTLAVGLVSRRSIRRLERTYTFVNNSRLMPVLWTVNWGHNLMSQTKYHCEPRIVVWLRSSTAEPCICYKQVREKPPGEHLKCMHDWEIGLYTGFVHSPGSTHSRDCNAIVTSASTTYDFVQTLDSTYSQDRNATATSAGTIYGFVQTLKPGSH